MRTPLAFLITVCVMIGLAPAASATSYSVDFSKSMGVFRADVGRNNGMNCRAENVVSKPKFLRLNASGDSDCGRISSEGVGTFYDGKYRTLVRHKKTSGSWYGDMIMFVNGPSKTCQLCNGEIDPIEWVQNGKSGRWNWRVHSVYSGTTRRCSSGSTFNAELNKHFVKVGLNIKPDKITFWKGKKKFGTVTRASHTAKGCTWPFNAVGGKIRGMRMVFSARLGGFGGTVASSAKAWSKIKNVVVKPIK